MDSWYRGRLSNHESIHLPDTGFTSDTGVYRFLQHFLKHIGAYPSANLAVDSGAQPDANPGTNLGADQPYKLLLMDNHGSHLTPEFIQLAKQHNIIAFTFPAHLTHACKLLLLVYFK